MAERAGAGWRLPWEPLVVAAVLLAGWEVSARVLSIPEYLLPRPLGIVETMVTDAGQMLSNLALTLGEALAGFAGGVLLGIVIAFGIATSSFLRRELQPLIVFSQSMPTVALAPLLVVWFGLGVAPKALRHFGFPRRAKCAPDARNLDPRLRPLQGAGGRDRHARRTPRPKGSARGLFRLKPERKPQWAIAAFASILSVRPDAMITFTESLTISHRQEIGNFAVTHRLPMIAELREFSVAGGIAFPVRGSVAVSEGAGNGQCACAHAKRA